MRRLSALTLILLLGAGCAAPASPAPGSSPAGSPEPISPAPGSPTETSSPASDPTGEATASPTARATAGPTSEPSLPEGHFVNPVLDFNFPDPHVIEVDGVFHAYATTGLGHNIQYSSSSDMVTWERPAEALPRLPLWSPGHTWAPEVAQTSAGFVMYYTLRASGLRRPDGQGSQCISIAVADDPSGPFVDEGEEPVVCQSELGGSIDAHHFVDHDGTPYLVWKNDGNCCNMLTRMYIQQLSEDGLELLGEPTEMGIRNDQSWEGAVIEAPTLWLHQSSYYLFYSANSYSDHRYAVGYAVSESLTGPYEKPQTEPILVTTRPAVGPGHQTLITDAAGDIWVYYHAWDEGRVGDQAGGQRRMWLDRLTFEDGVPVIHGPTAEPQPVPQTAP